jgi:hypothetical protein
LGRAQSAWRGPAGLRPGLTRPGDIPEHIATLASSASALDSTSHNGHVTTDDFSEAAAPMLAELETAGLDTSDFGLFTSLRPTTFDYARAVPFLIDWLPRIDHPKVVDSIARSLTGQRAARGEGARRLIEAFERLPNDEQATLWAIGNALSTIAGPSDADALIVLLLDRRYGIARQMLCDALARTGDPRTAAVLTELIDDDDVSGHAVLALRRLGRWKGLPDEAGARPKLQRLLQRPTAGEFAKKQAAKALASMDRTADRRLSTG